MNYATSGHMAASEAERGHMSPYEIGILLHYYAFSGDYPKRNGELFIPTMGKFYSLGLVDSGEPERAWKLTEKGQFYVKEGLCRVSLPVSEWRIPYEQA